MKSPQLDRNDTATINTAHQQRQAMISPQLDRNETATIETARQQRQAMKPQFMQHADWQPGRIMSPMMVVPIQAQMSEGSSASFYNVNLIQSSAESLKTANQAVQPNCNSMQSFTKPMHGGVFSDKDGRGSVGSIITSGHGHFSPQQMLSAVTPDLAVRGRPNDFYSGKKREDEFSDCRTPPSKNMEASTLKPASLPYKVAEQHPVLLRRQTPYPNNKLHSMDLICDPQIALQQLAQKVNTHTPKICLNPSATSNSRFAISQIGAKSVSPLPKVRVELSPRNQRVLDGIVSPNQMSVKELQPSSTMQRLALQQTLLQQHDQKTVTSPVASKVVTKKVRKCANNNYATQQPAVAVKLVKKGGPGNGIVIPKALLQFQRDPRIANGKQQPQRQLKVQKVVTKTSKAKLLKSQSQKRLNQTQSTGQDEAVTLKFESQRLIVPATEVGSPATTQRQSRVTACLVNKGRCESEELKQEAQTMNGGQNSASTARDILTTRGSTVVDILTTRGSTVVSKEAQDVQSTTDGQPMASISRSPSNGPTAGQPTSIRLMVKGTSDPAYQHIQQQPETGTSAKVHAVSSGGTQSPSCERNALQSPELYRVQPSSRGEYQTSKRRFERHSTDAQQQYKPLAAPRTKDLILTEGHKREKKVLSSPSLSTGDKQDQAKLGGGTKVQINVDNMQSENPVSERGDLNDIETRTEQLVTPLGQVSSRSRMSPMPESPDSTRVTSHLLLDNFRDALKMKQRKRNDPNRFLGDGMALELKKKSRIGRSANTLIESLLLQQKTEKEDRTYQSLLVTKDAKLGEEGSPDKLKHSVSLKTISTPLRDQDSRNKGATGPLLTPTVANGRQPRTILKMSDMYKNFARGDMTEKQRFSRVLSQVKQLENKGTSQLIKTLRKQAKTLKMSRKKILLSSCSMTDYQTCLLDVQRLPSHRGIHQPGANLLDSCASVASFASYRSNVSSSAVQPVKATKDAVNVEQIKRRLKLQLR